MQQQDKKVDRYMELFFRYRNDPNRDEIIAREMGWTWLLDAMKESGEAPADDEEIEEGEEWKSAAGVNAEEAFELDDFKHLPVYQSAHRFVLRAYDLVEHLPENVRQDSAVVDFISNTMIASAKIAGGTGMGNDIEELGGNIAYCKRGLAAANLAVAALHEMKEKNIVGGDRYLELVKEAIEVRNTIALHILELREKFRRGI